MKRLKAIVLGATGATGQELVKLLLKDFRFSKVIIFVRKNPKIKHQGQAKSRHPESRREPLTPEEPPAEGRKKGKGT
jgi:aspartate-semialdehyde dehydrogenase